MTRKRFCINCRHCLASTSEDGYVFRYCEVHKHYIPYVIVFDGWCRRWSKEKSNGD